MGFDLNNSDVLEDSATAVLQVSQDSFVSNRVLQYKNTLINGVGSVQPYEGGGIDISTSSMIKLSPYVKELLTKAFVNIVFDIRLFSSNLKASFDEGVISYTRDGEASAT